MQLYDLDRPELKDRPLQLATPVALRKSGNYFEAIKARTLFCIIPKLPTTRSLTSLTQLLLTRK